MSPADSKASRDNTRPWVVLPVDWWFKLDEGWQASLLGLLIVATVFSHEFVP